MSEVNNNPDRHELGSGDGIHKTVMEHVNDIIFKYNIRTHKLYKEADKKGKDIDSECKAEVEEFLIKGIFNDN